jgi:hypothetical protein
VPALLAPGGEMSPGTSPPAFAAAVVCCLLRRLTNKLPIALLGGLGVGWIAISAIAAPSGPVRAEPPEVTSSARSSHKQHNASAQYLPGGHTVVLDGSENRGLTVRCQWSRRCSTSSPVCCGIGIVR